MATNNVAKGGKTGKQVMVPVSRKSAVASPKVNKLSAGKKVPAPGIVTGTTVHAPGHDGFSHHPAC